MKPVIHKYSISDERTSRMLIIFLFYSVVNCFATKEKKQVADKSICFHGDDVDWVIKLIRDGKWEEKGETHISPTPGKNPEETVRPIDCGDINKNHGNGVYKIYPKISKTGFPVFFDFKTDGGGWTVFHTRLNGKTDFFRGWKAYEKGFGDIQHEFWLGNSKRSQITTQAKYELRIDMEDISEKKWYAKYKKFLVEDASMNFSSIVRGYIGNAGDFLQYTNGRPFSTKNNDLDRHPEGNCAAQYKGAWWYDSCYDTGLTGVYKKGYGTQWFNEKMKKYFTMVSSSMKVRRRKEKK